MQQNLYDPIVGASITYVSLDTMLAPTILTEIVHLLASPICFTNTYFESGYFESFVADTTAMIAPFVEKDPTAFCSFEDWRLGVETSKNFCLLRAESVRGQLDGTIPYTIAAQEMDKSAFVDASEIWLPDMGEVAEPKDGYR